MKQEIKDFLKGAFYTSGSPNVPIIMASIGYAAFLMGSGFLLVRGMQWAHYETFAALTAGGATAALFGNKLVDSKYNSQPGQMPDNNPKG